MNATTCGMILAMLLVPLSAAAKQPQVHEDAPLRVSRVLLISIDGLHAVNFANYIQSNPDSTLAQLSAIGVSYTNASTSRPSDSIPGFLPRSQAELREPLVFGMKSATGGTFRHRIPTARQSEPSFTLTTRLIPMQASSMGAESM